MSLVVGESAVASSRSAMVRCDNDDVTFDSIPFSYVLIYVSVMGALLWCRLLFEKAQLYVRYYYREDMLGS